MGYDPRSLPPFWALDERVNTHPDMLLFPLSDGFLADRRYLRENASFFKALRVRTIPAGALLSADYPHDTALNALSYKEIVFGGKAVDQTILASHKRYVPVRQGYTRCAGALVGNGIITADKSLYKALQGEKIPCLLISPGHIALPGYNVGFIGGASLTLDSTLTAFFGKIEAHPDYESMKAFADTQGATLLSLSDEVLTDCGGGHRLLFTQIEVK